MTRGEDGPICDLTELPVAWCHHCRAPFRPRRRGLTPISTPAGTEVRARFTARYGGTCAACGEHYREGDSIGVTIDDDYVCEECV